MFQQEIIPREGTVLHIADWDSQGAFYSLTVDIEYPLKELAKGVRK